MSADEDNDCDSVQNRGVSTGKNLKNKKSNDLHINFNAHGQPCGLNHGRFSSDMGVLARNIKITYENWKKVPWGLKETIWNDAKRTWNLDDDKQKIVLKILSKAHKEFKSRLTRTYITKTMKPKNGKVVDESPVGKYQQITKEDWDEFKKQRKEKSFLEKSAKAQASQKMNEYPHYLGRSGYEGKMEKWYKEELTLELERETLNGDPNPTLTEETIESVTSRLSDRGARWVKAHTPLSGSPPPRTKQVIDNFNHWKTLEDKGEYVPSRYEDALVKAIGKPDHFGRARGVGTYATLQSYFGKPSRSARTYTEEDVTLLIEKVKKETIDEVNAMMEKKWAEMMGKMSPIKGNGNGNVESSMMEPLPRGQVQSSCHSTHPIDPFVELKEPTRCRLAVCLNKELIVVAEALVYPWIEGCTVHHKPLTAENAKVCIDDVIRPEALLPLPWDEFTTVAHATGSFAQWPKSLITLEANEGNIEKQKRINKPKDTKESANRLRKKAKSITTVTDKKKNQVNEEQDRRPLSVEELMTLGRSCRSLEEKLCSMSKDDTIKIVIDKSVYNCLDEEGNCKSIESFLSIVEIRQMFRNQWINVVTLQAWGSFLHQYATQMKVIDKVGFMCPVKLTEYMRNPPHCEDYIARVMKTKEKKKFIMGPFYESNHWMLIVICLGASTIYILDSQQRVAKNFEIKGRLNGAWALHRIHGGRRNFVNPTKLNIKDKIKCRQQPGSYECGYYVMKWMYNITFYYSTANEEDFEKHIATAAMTVDVVNEMKEMWANKCLENIQDDDK